MADKLIKSNPKRNRIRMILKIIRMRFVESYLDIRLDLPVI